jgi:ABC-type transport system substrate-binding protein
VKKEKFRRLCALIAAAAVLMSAFSGCSMLELVAETEDEEAGVTPGSTLLSSYAADSIFSLNYDSNNSMNPLLTTSSANLLFMPLIYDCLFDVDENYNFAPNLISDYRTEDGKCWYFDVDTSRRFHNGSRLTAQDAVYSIQRAMSSTVYSERLSIIVGISAMDDTTFVVNISKVNYLFPALLNVPVIPNDSIDQYSPSGTGAYAVSADFTKLELSSSYPKASEYPIDTIYLKEYSSADEQISAFEDSLIDLVTNDPNSISSLGYGSANEMRYYSTTNMHYIGYNAGSLFFQNSAYRAAVTYAVNRSAIVTNIMSGCGTATTLPISPMSDLYNATYAASFDYDMDKCEAILDANECEDYDEDGDREYMLTGIAMEINLVFIVCSDSSVKVSAAREIAEDLRSLGISVTLRELSWDDYNTALENGNFDMYYAETRLTADFDLSRLITTGGSLNYGKVYDTSVKQSIEDYLSASDDDRRMACDLMCQAVAESALITPICFEKQQVLTHRGIVSGVSATQYNIFNCFENWEIDLT